jgi:hypothetical protein
VNETELILAELQSIRTRLDGLGTQIAELSTQLATAADRNRMLAEERLNRLEGLVSQTQLGQELMGIAFTLRAADRGLDVASSIFARLPEQYDPNAEGAARP